MAHQASASMHSQRCDGTKNTGLIENNGNKKVLLRDRKRHTARRVAGARSAFLSWGGGTPVQAVGPGGGVVQSQLGGFPVLSWPEGSSWQAYPPAGTGVSPSAGTGVHPQKGPGTRNLVKNPGLEYPWKGPGKEPETRVPPGKDLEPETWERTWNWGTPTVWTDTYQTLRLNLKKLKEVNFLEKQP